MHPLAAGLKLLVQSIKRKNQVLNSLSRDSFQNLGAVHFKSETNASLCVSTS
jgi:hypothetical protein